MVPVLSRSNTSTSPAAPQHDRNGDDVRLDHAIHSGDAHGRQEPADRRRDETDQQRNERRQSDRRAMACGLYTIEREGQQRHGNEQKDDGQCGQ